MLAATLMLYICNVNDGVSCAQAVKQTDLDHWPYAAQLLGHIYNGDLYERIVLQ